jgi:beta-1,4-mannosyl-glycoprotein beta-1,4-N-acetylglucosaminyltransferase
MVKVIDCSLFFNEFDLLEIRLNELSELIDRFVIMEATSTFSGLPKPLYFEKNSGRFSSFADRLRVVTVRDFIDPAESTWARQARHRNALAEGFVDASEDDIVILSDADELVSPAAIRELRDYPPRRGEVVCFELRMYNYFLNTECATRWLRTGPRAARVGDIRTLEVLRRVRGPTGSRLRDLARAARSSLEARHPVKRRVIRDAGWHFSYLGGVAAIQEKMRSFSGYSRVPPNILDPVQLAAKIAAGSPISFSRGGLALRDIESGFPDYVQRHRERFAHLIATPAQFQGLHVFRETPAHSFSNA